MFLRIGEAFLLCCLSITSLGLLVNGQGFGDFESLGSFDLTLYNDSACSHQLPIPQATSLQAESASICRSPPLQWVASGISSYSASCVNLSDSAGWHMFLNVYTWPIANCPSNSAANASYLLTIYRGQSEQSSTGAQCAQVGVTNALTVDGRMVNSTNSVAYMSFLCKASENSVSFNAKSNSDLALILIFLVMLLSSA